MLVVSRLLTVLVGVVSLLVTACQSDAIPAPSSPIAWRIGIIDDATTTNIWSILGPNATVQNFYTQLNRYPFLYGLSEVNFAWVPAWAAGFPSTFVQEGDLWTSTVKLKAGARWSDGKPITAHDVAFTINTVLEFQLPGNWQNQVDPKVMVRAEATDDQTVKYYFKARPGLAQWQYGTSSIIFVSSHFWKPLVNEARKAATPEERTKALFAIIPRGEPTAGPMVFVKWEKGAFLEVKANPEYFFSGSKVVQFNNGAYMEEKPGVYKEVAYGEPTGDVALQFTRGPYANSIIYNTYASQSAAVLALLSGQVDYLAIPQGLERGFQQQLSTRPDIKVITNVSNNVHYLGFNTRRPPMNIKEFRQAIAFLIDKEFMTSAILQDIAYPAYTMVPPGNGFWHNPDVPQLGKGLEREQRIIEAVRLLKSAGFTWEGGEPKWNRDKLAIDPGGRLKMPGGDPVPQLELLAPSASYDPLRATFAIWIERWLTEVGIPVKANLTGFNVIVDRVWDQHAMDMWILGYSLAIFPDHLVSVFHSKRVTKGDDNASGYSNPAFDTMVDSLVVETEVNKAREISHQMQQILAEEAPYVPLYSTQILDPVRINVKFPFETSLNGLQSYLQSANGALAYTQFQ